MAKLFIIKDWAGNRMFPNNTFESYEEGWDFIYQNVDNSKYEESGDDNDDEYQEYWVLPLKK